MIETPNPLLQSFAEQTQRLLDYNDAVLEQAQTLAEGFMRLSGADYASVVGPHLRHVIEHFDALLIGRTGCEVDYDQRPRDAALQASPALAVQRIERLRAALRELDEEQVEAAVIVFTLGGLQGEWSLANSSTLGRELVFAASHAVHHFALLREQACKQGLTLSAQFGKAPATLAAERAAQASSSTSKGHS